MDIDENYGTEQYIALNLKDTLAWNGLRYFTYKIHVYKIYVLINKSQLNNHVSS